LYLLVIVGPTLCGCTFSFDLGTGTLFPAGSSFVLKGTAQEVATDNGPCLAWLGENGEVYHLFQTVDVDSDEFDTVTTPGTTSRLEIGTRSDLTVACRIGTIVEVRDILEIVP
jgi:hypothetical protein